MPVIERAANPRVLRELSSPSRVLIKCYIDSMLRYLKLLTLCLIMIAIPFKGIAAGSVMLCEPVHDHASHGSAHHENAHDHAHAEHAHDHHNGSYPGSDPALNGEQLSNLDAGAIGQQSGAADQSTCTTCGAHAVAGSPDEVVPAFLRASSVVISFLSSLYVGIFTDGLERPPKAIFA